MKQFASIAIVLAFAVVGAGCATSSSMQVPVPTGPSQAPTAQAPWTKAQALVQATGADVMRRGIQAIRPHVQDLEKALAEGKPLFGANRSNPGIVLADGPAETLVALLGAAAQKQSVSAIANPYPMVGFFLGTYYNEIGRSGDALHALDTGLELSPVPGSDLGETVPLLLSERGAALNALKRPEDSLDNYDRALKIKSLKDFQRAIMLRGRGFALTELGRLDEAETSYRDSLKSEPNNPRALAELNYIARLRAGAPAAPGRLIVRMPMTMPGI